MLRLYDHSRLAEDKLYQETTRDTDLEERIQREIMQSTWGRVRRLRVEASPGTVVVEGITMSYYLKQLAIKAVMEVVGSLPETPSVVVEIALDAMADLRRGSYTHS